MIGIEFREWFFETVFNGESPIRVSLHNFEPDEFGSGMVRARIVPDGGWDINLEDSIATMADDLDFGFASGPDVFTDYGLWWNDGPLFIVSHPLEEPVEVDEDVPIIIEASDISVHFTTLLAALAEINE